MATNEIVTNALDGFNELQLWQRVALTSVLAMLTFVCCWSFEPSTARRRHAATSTVYSSNIVMMLVLAVTACVVGALYVVGCTTAAYCGFVGAVVYFAGDLIAGGSFLGIVVWGVGGLSTMHLVNTSFGLADMPSYYLLFTIAVVLAYPAFALVFPDKYVNATAAYTLARMLFACDEVHTGSFWLFACGVFFLLQSVAHPSYRTNETSFMVAAAMFGMVLFSHAHVIVDPSSKINAVVAITSGVLSVLTVLHNRKTSVFVRYDPHETRAAVVSAVVFLIFVVRASGEEQGADYVSGLLYMTAGHAIASAITASVFLIGAIWLPEDAPAWRLVTVDSIMLLPFLALPITVVAYQLNAVSYFVAAAQATGLDSNFLVTYARDSPFSSLFLIAIMRVLSDLCARALSSHNMTFLPLLVSTRDRGSARSNLLGLTFNGGPDPETTPALLGLLREYDATATFFITHERAAAYPKLVRDIHDDGHQIGVLGTGRVDPFGVGAVQETIKARSVIEYITGTVPTLYRPPVSGARSPLALQSIAGLGMTIAMWSLCPWEWQGTEAEVYSRVPSFLDSAGYVVLLHEVIPPTVSGELVSKSNPKCVDTAALLLRDLATKDMQCVTMESLCLPSQETLP